MSDALWQCLADAAVFLFERFHHQPTTTTKGI